MKIPKSFHLILLFGYLLGVHNGYIALWQGDDPEPVQVFPYRSDLLPEQDRLRLESGIEITRDAELHSLLEDYLS